MSASTAAGSPMTAGGAQEGSRPSPLVLAARIAIVLIAVAALLSPLYAAMRGLDFLNQPPPVTWQGNGGGASDTTSHGSGAGAGTSGGAQAPAGGFGGC